MTVVVASVLATAFVLLARWGLHNLEELVPVRRTAERREKELRSLRRGARSCLVIGLLFGTWALVLGVTEVARVA